MKRYWYKICPTCQEGRLFVKRRNDNSGLYLLCEECFCSFDTPADASDGNNCREGMDAQGVYATDKDISKYKWCDFALQEVS